MGKQCNKICGTIYGVQYSWNNFLIYMGPAGKLI